MVGKLVSDFIGAGVSCGHTAFTWCIDNRYKPPVGDPPAWAKADQPFTIWLRSKCTRTLGHPADYISEKERPTGSFMIFGGVRSDTSDTKFDWLARIDRQNEVLLRNICGYPLKPRSIAEPFRQDVDSETRFPFELAGPEQIAVECQAREKLDAFLRALGPPRDAGIEQQFFLSRFFN